MNQKRTETAVSAFDDRTSRDINLEQARAILGVSHTTMLRWTYLGILDVKEYDGERRLSSAHVRAWALARKKRETRLDWIKVAKARGKSTPA